MRSRAPLRVVLLVLLVVLGAIELGACRPDVERYEWDIVLEHESLRTSIAAIAARIRTGECGGAATAPVYEAQFAPDAQGPAPPRLSPGRYALEVDARDARCMRIAHGCISATLPLDGASVLRVPIADDPVPDEGCGACARCEEGMCAGAPQASSTNLCRLDFETGTPLPWPHVQVDASSSLDFVRDPVRQGSFAGCFTLGDGGEIALLSWFGASMQGDDRYYAWSQRFETPRSGEDPRFLIFPSEFEPGVGAPAALGMYSSSPIEVTLYTGDLVITETGTSAELNVPYTLSFPYEPGTWHDFVMHVRWSADHDGELDLWHRAETETVFQRELELRDLPTLQRVDGVPRPIGPRIGLIRSGPMTNVRDLCMDGFRVGRSYDEIVADFCLPLPSDAPLCPELASLAP